MINKILCFLGFHKFQRYERLRNKWGNPSDDSYMLICKNCKKRIVKNK